VSSLFNDFSPNNNQNPIDVSQCRKPMSNNKGRPVFCQYIQDLKYFDLRFRIDIGGRLIKDYNRGILYQYAGNGNALFLAD